jgi:hypothetical protein
MNEANNKYSTYELEFYVVCASFGTLQALFSIEGICILHRSSSVEIDQQLKQDESY